MFNNQDKLRIILHEKDSFFLYSIWALLVYGYAEKPAYGKGGTMYKTFAHSSSCEFTKSKNGSIKTCSLN